MQQDTAPSNRGTKCYQVDEINDISNAVFALNEARCEDRNLSFVVDDGGSLLAVFDKIALI